MRPYFDQKSIAMNRFLLPALLAAMPVFAEDLGVCRAVPYSKDNCFRVLACVGSAIAAMTYFAKALGPPTGQWALGLVR